MCSKRVINFKRMLIAGNENTSWLKNHQVLGQKKKTKKCSCGILIFSRILNGLSVSFLKKQNKTKQKPSKQLIHQQKTELIPPLWLPFSEKFNSPNSQMEYDLISSIFITPPSSSWPSWALKCSPSSAADYDRRNVTERGSRVYLFCSCLWRTLKKTEMLSLCCGCAHTLHKEGGWWWQRMIDCKNRVIEAFALYLKQTIQFWDNIYWTEARTLSLSCVMQILVKQPGGRRNA